MRTNDTATSGVPVSVAGRGTDDEASSGPRIALVGGFLPRRCGIATFTSHLYEVLRRLVPPGSLRAFVVDDRPGGYRYPEAVWAHFHEADPEAYDQTADAINAWAPDAVLVQHEYGIYGGTAGRHLLRLLDRLRVPVVTTLHTVLDDPDPDQFHVLCEIARKSERVVVMNARSREKLMSVYGIPPDRIVVVPHGVPDIPFRPTEKGACQTRKIRLLTFGLLSRRKGLEYAIEALPDIVRRFPNVEYTILGATHPHVLKAEGETYREELKAMAARLGVASHVRFEDGFVSEPELVRILAKADVYVTPYLDRAQASSGTLAYAIGAGLAVLSTPYHCAQDLLAGHRGVLVPFRDSKAMGEAVTGLLEDEEALRQLQRDAYAFGRSMRWRRVAAAYHGVVARVVRPPEPRNASLWQQPRHRPIRLANDGLVLDHLVRLTDDIGLVQHAVLASPDTRSGYATDDNARALLLTSTLRADETKPPRIVNRLHDVYLQFLLDAFDRRRGRFRNLYHPVGGWDRTPGSEDCHGRAVWALGHAVRQARDPKEAERAERLLRAAMPAIDGFHSPRALAFAVLGLVEYANVAPPDILMRLRVRTFADRLDRLYRDSKRADWVWFEPVLSYGNARLPQALLAAGRFLHDNRLVDEGLAALGWLMRVQRPEGTHFVPIGSEGFWRRGNRRAHFDQQPVEAWCTIDACLQAYGLSGEGRWLEDAQIAYAWFLGENDLREPLHDPETGGCRDGLHPDRPNRNEGAESTLAWLFSTHAIGKVRTGPVAAGTPQGPPRIIHSLPTRGRRAALKSEFVAHLLQGFDSSADKIDNPSPTLCGLVG